MNDLKGLRVVVAGAGAIGSVLALRLVREGAEVTLADPAGAGDNASGVAAGMLAPLLEALLDPVAAGHYPLLKAARDAWPALIVDLPGAPALDRQGAMARAPDAEGLLARARALGARARLLDQDQALSLMPGLVGDGPFLFSDDDWRLDAGAMLQALQAEFVRLGGRRLRLAMREVSSGVARFEDQTVWLADAVILATGPQASAALGPGAVDQLIPVKGQILRFPGAGPLQGPVVRGEGVYVVPTSDGAIVGATMEEGRFDLAIDAQAAALQVSAAKLFPALASARFTASAGIRMATPDGLPLAGPSGTMGLMVARGARRNGWLLALLIAEVIVDHLLERPASAAARAFDPLRFR